MGLPFLEFLTTLVAEGLQGHVQVTQRYLFPLDLLATYGLVRLPPTRRVLTHHVRPLGWSYAAGVFVGGQLFFAAVLLGDLSVGEAFRLHATVNLALAAFLALMLVVASRRSAYERLAAIAVGLAAAAGTVFVVMAGIVYFQIGPYALPLVEELAQAIASA